MTLIAAAPSAIVRSPIRGAVMPLMATLVALAVLLGAAALLQLRIGLRPLRTLRAQVAQIRGGARDRVDEDQPSELQPLAAELNALAADNAAALAAARLSAANLAHALKTSVAALALDLRGHQALAGKVARIDDTIRHHLARARTETVNRRASTPLSPATVDVVSTIRQLHADRHLAISMDVPSDLYVAVDARDLDEIIGNLLDNAAQYAAHHIRLAACCDSADAGLVTVAIGDDGPGISEEERARVVEPGRRLDERGDGHGFGLSIVKDLVSLYGGGMTLSQSPEGGLLVVLSLPSGRR